MSTVLAAGLFCLAALLAGRAPIGIGSHRGPGLVGLAGQAVVAGAAFAVLISLSVAPLVVVVVVGAILGGLRSLRRRQRRRAADARRRDVLRACEGLAADVAAGQPPHRALRAMADDWPELRPIADAADIGADVPAVFRTLAGLPGAEALRVAAAAWAVAQHSGSGLAEVLGIAADDMRTEQATARIVATELAAALATARLLALLPIGVLVLGRGMGGNPIGFLVATAGGQACLAVGVALVWIGSEWLERLADQVVGP